ncbi:hypothetical protein PHYBOEH_011465 [Phytophthora boehmeriae]|uniref:RxLR effector protein n=1 Tax=Phytophthora boehmeriae TaxID=109152 RepID=A0A8T1X3H1_9STRA|nr:hypothetical protein PHYBOEH_011465 [Phytophthora boehmeriae]
MRFHLFHMIAAATLLTSVGALSTATVSESSNIAKLPSGSEQLHGVNKGRFLRVKEVVDDEKQGDDDDGDEEKMFKAEVAFAAQLMSKMRIEKEIDTAVASFFSLKFTPSKLFAHYDLKHVPRGDIKWSIYSKFKVDFKKKYPHRIA